jgi:hypothetical protein
MTDLDLDAIQARVDAATDGPWEVDYDEGWCFIDLEHPDCKYPDEMLLWRKPYDDGEEDHEHRLSSANHVLTASGRVTGNYDWDAGGILETVDVEFIAHARTDIPALIAEVKALRGKVAEVEELTQQVAVNAEVNSEGSDGR